MTQISRDDVIKLANLSGLQLADDELAGLQTDIDTILSYVKELDELDTSGVEPVYQVTGLENVYRDDVVATGEVSRETLLALAPETKNSQIKVPKVI